MTASLRPAPWLARPGRVLGGTLAFALALLTILLGTRQAASGRSPLWLVGAVLLSLWVGFKGAPLLLRLLRRAGVFGRLHLDGRRLVLGRGSRVLDLGEPFSVEARYQSSSIRREYDMRHVLWFSALRPSRKRIRRHELRVAVLTVAVEQAGRRFLLVGDESTRRPGPDHDADALRVRRVPIGRSAGRPVRMWVADLAQVLAHLQAAPGHEAVTTPLPETKLEDPRRAVWPMRAIVASFAAVLIAFVAALVWILDHHETARERASGGRRRAVPLVERTRRAGACLAGRVIPLRPAGR